MWKYSETLMDHFMNPRNSGRLEDPDGHSEVGSPQCGDAMTLDIRVDDEDRISDIRFMTFGCAGAIAAASALTELARGRTIEEALKIENRDIVEFLDGMPEEKYHCSVMGHEALSAAVDDYRSRRDRTAIELRKLLEQPPGELSVLLGDSRPEVRHVHPSRVTVALPGSDPVPSAGVLERFLRERTGRSVEVSVCE